MASEGGKMTPEEALEECKSMIISRSRYIANSASMVDVPAEDLAQDGAVAVLDAAKRYDPSKGANFSTFAYYRINGAMYDSQRNWGAASKYDIQKKRLVLPVEINEALDEEDDSVSGFDFVAKQQDKRDLLRAISSLNERDQDILYCHYWQEMNMFDIGERHGLSKSRICRIIGDLRSRIGRILKHQRKEAIDD